MSTKQALVLVIAGLFAALSWRGFALIGEPNEQMPALPEFVIPARAVPFTHVGATASKEWPRRLFGLIESVGNSNEQAAAVQSKDLEPLLVGIVIHEKIRTAIIRYDNRILRLQEQAIFGPWTVEKIDTRTTKIRSATKTEELRVDR